MTESSTCFFDHIADRLSPLEDSADGLFQLKAGNGESSIDLREDPVRPNTIYIAWLETSLGHQRKGHADELLQVVCNVADSCHVDLSLRVEDTPDNDWHALASWYRKLGFCGERDEMIRKFG